MIRICPNPRPWNEAFQRLGIYAKTHLCAPEKPPVPLILAGWCCTDDFDKKERWQETLEWAGNNNCRFLLDSIREEDFYSVDKLTSLGPMYRAWDCETKARPSIEDAAEYLDRLISRWPDIVGPELGAITHPVRFTGEKRRRLLVKADGDSVPPWGGWFSLSSTEVKRRTFTSFRQAINNAISPHEVDHVGFTTSARVSPSSDGLPAV